MNYRDETNLFMNHRDKHIPQYIIVNNKSLIPGGPSARSGAASAAAAAAQALAVRIIPYTSNPRNINPIHLTRLTIDPLHLKRLIPYT